MNAMRQRAMLIYVGAETEPAEPEGCADGRVRVVKAREPWFFP